ncbi:ABC transporter permease subunit, partial [Salmonella enterica]|uniref:Orn/Lys/Arg family decarboxylase n=1 Tax=Salmonella enterica TaxID=28901 RepID=UPI00313A0C3C
LVVLFIYFGSSQLLLTLSDGFTINLGFVQIPVQMDIENFDVSPFLCGVIALSLLYAAYASQTLRGALKAVPVGQWESGQALGLSKSDIFVRLVMPQMCGRPQRRISGEGEAVPLDHLPVRFTANNLLPYPPSGPLLSPGERITQQIRA